MLINANKLSSELSDFVVVWLFVDLEVFVELALLSGLLRSDSNQSGKSELELSSSSLELVVFVEVEVLLTDWVVRADPNNQLKKPSLSVELAAD